MTLVTAGIAVLGLLRWSPAAVIGAMLISSLMGQGIAASRVARRVVGGNVIPGWQIWR